MGSRFRLMEALGILMAVLLIQLLNPTRLENWPALQECNFDGSLVHFSKPLTFLWNNSCGVCHLMHEKLLHVGDVLGVRLVVNL